MAGQSVGLVNRVQPLREILPGTGRRRRRGAGDDVRGAASAAERRRSGFQDSGINLDDGCGSRPPPRRGVPPYARIRRCHDVQNCPVSARGWRGCAPRSSPSCRSRPRVARAPTGRHFLPPRPTRRGTILPTRTGWPQAGESARSARRARGRMPSGRRARHPCCWNWRGSTSGWASCRAPRRCAREALVLMPESPEAHLRMGDVYLALGWPKSALESYEEAPSGWRPASRCRARALVAGLLEAGHAAVAEDRCLKFIAAQPDDPQLWLALGQVFEKQDKLREAFTTYGQVLGLDPASAEAYARQGRLFCRFGQFSSAADACRQGARTGRGQPGRARLPGHRLQLSRRRRSRRAITRRSPRPAA